MSDPKNKNKKDAGDLPPEADFVEDDEESSLPELEDAAAEPGTDLGIDLESNPPVARRSCVTASSRRPRRASTA